jgi:signal peptidase I
VSARARPSTRRRAPRTRAERLTLRQRRRRWLLFALVLPFVLAVVAWTYPVTLGGRTAYVIVAGNSMRPTYAPGDLVITRATDQHEAGDVVLYRVPEGEPGENLRVIHRIVRVNPDHTFVTQGDNRDRADQWTPGPEDIEGEPRFVIRGLGLWLRRFIDPIVLASIMGASILWATWPAPEPGARRGRRRRARPRAVQPM